MILNTQTN